MELPVADDTALLIDQIKNLAIVRGKVTLSSGRKADYYVDMRRVTLDGVAAPIVGRVMRDLVADWDFDAVGGLTLGADPVAAAMLHAAAIADQRLDAFVVRKAGKAHGLQRRIEGAPVDGRRVLAVEDTCTTGGSVLTAVEALRDAGAEVVGVAVIVDRGTGAREAVEAAGSGVSVRGVGARSRPVLTRGPSLRGFKGVVPLAEPYCGAARSMVARSARGVTSRGRSTTWAPPSP